MNIRLIAIGKTDHPDILRLTGEYIKRLSHYVRFDVEIVPDIRNSKSLPELQQKEKEGELILAKLNPSEFVVLLDEKGKTFTSVGFAAEIQKRMNSGIKTLTFVVGGPYGFSDAVYKRANSKVSLSQMTFSHQMIRLFFAEQLYRAFTILNNEPYHHQ